MPQMIHLKGPGLNDWFAEQMVDMYGAEAALEKTAGPMHEAVKRVIEVRAAAAMAKGE